MQTLSAEGFHRWAFIFSWRSFYSAGRGASLLDPFDICFAPGARRQPVSRRAGLVSLMTMHRRGAAAALIGALCLAAVPWLAQATGEPLIISLVTRMLIYALAAVSLDLILGIGGMVSFGHAAYFGLGGYVVGILAFHSASGEAFFGVLAGSNLALVAWPAAVAVCTVAALILGALSLRTAGGN